MTLPAWMYGNPEEIADGLIKRTERNKEAEKKQMVWQRRKNQRKIQSLMRKVRCK